MDEIDLFFIHGCYKDTDAFETLRALGDLVTAGKIHPIGWSNVTGWQLERIRTHLADFIAAYNVARRLKTLSGLTLYEYICKIWTSEPDRFILISLHQMPGLNIQIEPEYHERHHCCRSHAKAISCARG
ncbi:hypothetical protein P775_11990 [Puniceibacterium antarcticum]|uniref:NADP-dependent oxidoreductase domain-containing protein n=1 Tax=Puniceibacterium antarcticum TaxID=1206336 RepID=A0A2G8REN5_9RHOB|nr:hypothetical protein P775_11990 [Puniceibacterium antarcticum]